MLRKQRLILNIIKKLNLNLKGLTILTEVGSNNYIFTPLIALMAGAKKVNAWTRDSHFGNAEEIINRCKNLCQKYSLDVNRIEFAFNERPIEHIKQADIITNLGFVRPLNRDFLKNINAKAVIPYMCESWEIREGDVDIDYCKSNNIQVAGTWENHPDLLIFDFCENLIEKICYEAGFEIKQNNILIVSNDNFGRAAFDVFKMRANNLRIVSIEKFHTIDFGELDFIFLSDYKNSIDIFTEEILQELSLKDISIVHLCGFLELNKIKEYGIKVYPQINGYQERMTRTLDYLGSKPLIDLHAAGLKVGELMFKKVESDLIQRII